MLPLPTVPMKGHLAISSQVFSDTRVQSTVGITQNTSLALGDVAVGVIMSLPGPDRARPALWREKELLDVIRRGFEKR